MPASYLVATGSGTVLNLACSTCTADAGSTLERLAGVLIESILPLGAFGVFILLIFFWVLPAIERVKARHEAKLKNLEHSDDD